jgi:hypothetical protein
VPKFDWFQTTFYGSCPTQSGLISDLFDHYDLVDFVPSKNLNGYHFGGSIKRGDQTLLHLCWGGQLGINAKATSHHAIEFHRFLKKTGREHSPTRLDACEDWFQEGFFDKVSKKLLSFANENRLTINQQGDWHNKKGRTLYIGSPTSPIRLVVYEKTQERLSAGAQDVPEHWVRVEVRFRPKGDLTRSIVANAEPDQIFCIGWVSGALKKIGYSNIKKLAIKTSWKPSETNKARLALIKQYKNVMLSWAEELDGWDNFGLEIEQKIIEFERLQNEFIS